MPSCTALCFVAISHPRRGTTQAMTSLCFTQVGTFRRPVHGEIGHVGSLMDRLASLVIWRTGHSHQVDSISDEHSRSKPRLLPSLKLGHSAPLLFLFGEHDLVARSTSAVTICPNWLVTFLVCLFMAAF